VAILTLHRDCAVASAFPPALLLGYGMVDESVIPRAVQELAKAVMQ
jgi:hypothetical protein